MRANARKPAIYTLFCFAVIATVKRLSNKRCEMPYVQGSNGAGNPVARSCVTNGKRIVLFGDGRSAGARRYRDIMRALAAELGGMTMLAQSEQQVVRRAAQTSVECEVIEAHRANGEAVDPIAYATAYNANRRAIHDFQALKGHYKPRHPSLAEVLAAERSVPEAA